jgi:hypothetical protein
MGVASFNRLGRRHGLKAAARHRYAARLRTTNQTRKP